MQTNNYSSRISTKMKDCIGAMETQRRDCHTLLAFGRGKNHKFSFVMIIGFLASYRGIHHTDTCMIHVLR